MIPIRKHTNLARALRMPLLALIIIFLFATLSCESGDDKKDKKTGRSTDVTEKSDETPNTKTASTKDKVINYEDDIKPLLTSSKCLTCHAKNGEPPVLTTYSEVKKVAEDIADIMQFNHYKISWSKDEKSKFRKWIDLSMPESSKTDAIKESDDTKSSAPTNSDDEDKLTDGATPEDTTGNTGEIGGIEDKDVNNDAEESAVDKVTFVADIRPLMDKLCNSCHATGKIRPYLDNYKDSKSSIKSRAFTVGHRGAFWSTDEKKVISEWIATGTLEK